MFYVVNHLFLKNQEIILNTKYVLSENVSSVSSLPEILVVLTLFKNVYNSF